MGLGRVLRSGLPTSCRVRKAVPGRFVITILQMWWWWAEITSNVNLDAPLFHSAIILILIVLAHYDAHLRYLGAFITEESFVPLESEALRFRSEPPFEQAGTRSESRWLRFCSLLTWESLHVSPFSAQKSETDSTEPTAR